MSHRLTITTTDAQTGRQSVEEFDDRELYEAAIAAKKRTYTITAETTTTEITVKRKAGDLFAATDLLYAP